MLTSYHEMSGEEHLKKKKKKVRAKYGRKSIIGNSSHLNVTIPR